MSTTFATSPKSSLRMWHLCLALLPVAILLTFLRSREGAALVIAISVLLGGSSVCWEILSRCNQVFERLTNDPSPRALVQRIALGIAMLWLLMTTIALGYSAAVVTVLLTMLTFLGGPH
jgi:hypothetical protein